jgi:hypothetical protein
MAIARRALVFRADTLVLPLVVSNEASASYFRFAVRDQPWPFGILAQLLPVPHPLAGEAAEV